jgi:uncharacterized protein YndB with AHSA1/START domain
MDHQQRKGDVVDDGASSSVVFERRLPYPIEAVWRALTDPEERAKWFGRTTLEARQGGAISMIADGPPMPEQVRSMTGEVLVWDPPHVFEHAWRQTLIGDTVVRYELRRDGDVTVLKLVHRGFRPKDAAGYIPGQHAYLDRLEAALAGQPAPAWQARYSEVAGLYGPLPSWG